MLPQCFLTAWHSSSEQGREIRHCIPLKEESKCRFEECNLPRLELGDNSVLLFIPSVCTHVWQPSYCRVLSFMLWWQKTDSRDAALCLQGCSTSSCRWSVCCIQLSMHVGTTATGSPGWMCLVAFQPWEALRQMCFEECIPQHSWCSISNLAVWMGTCPLVWLQKAEVIFLK